MIAPLEVFEVKEGAYEDDSSYLQNNTQDRINNDIPIFEAAEKTQEV